MDNLARTCDPPLCTACQLSRARTRPDGVTWTAIRAHNMAVRQGDLQPGDCILLDQYESSYLGRLPHTKEKEKLDDKYVGQTIGVDHASGLIFVEHQSSLRIGYTLKSKKKFERRCRLISGVKVEKYHADNGIFNSTGFQDHLDLMEQEIQFFGTGALHQNGVAERNIRPHSHGMGSHYATARNPALARWGRSGPVAFCYGPHCIFIEPPSRRRHGHSPN
jgi:hypothetical protein